VVRVLSLAILHRDHFDVTGQFLPVTTGYDVVSGGHGLFGLILAALLTPVQSC